MIHQHFNKKSNNLVAKRLNHMIIFSCRPIEFNNKLDVVFNFVKKIEV